MANSRAASACAEATPARYPGRKPLDDRAVLTGIPFVLQSGIPWEMLPQAIGCASGMSCLRRLRHRQQVGVWGRVHEVFLAKRRVADRIDWSRVVIDSSAIRGMACRRSPPVGERSAALRRGALTMNVDGASRRTKSGSAAIAPCSGTRHTDRRAEHAPPCRNLSPSRTR
ncbi:transposase [Burkholderia pseudomallei]|nr:putative transposase [Burkholderia pseudomallei MSHR1043]OMZ42079.1 transposase [Burkholderia pseudomallei]OMZ45677.1 transposase [Burkholderia pseudomallei]OMZ58722.1 transposase [Burkholderia pseudomallei]OMZ68878.1 transposase [Burkholderia pseudomallei]